MGHIKIINLKNIFKSFTESKVPAIFSISLVALLITQFASASESKNDFNESLAPLEKALAFADHKNKREALEHIKKWNPSEVYLMDYKTFWTALWSEDLEKVWKEYVSLKNEKKFLRLRLALFREFLKEENTFKSTRGFTSGHIQKEAQNVL